ncbi:DNA-directed primase/polymerase protein [Crotalus adamanteus]|uniref:DNA-directed primase/polymerase protein n=1 Tax=Crotalus adamanteus TaxID=8729 RepID=A0AAW1B9S0_CROAD
MNIGSTKRKWEEKLKNVEELASCYMQRPLCSSYKPKLSNALQPSSVWKLFYRQTHAFNFAKTCKEDVHVFALEKCDGNNQRLYLVTTYTELWFYYSKHETKLKHCYEVIPETAVCKLYFDLEFYKPTNQEANANQMVADLIKFIGRKLDEYYGIKCSAENILKLDSSTEEKYSCHLIFLFENAAFKNNIHIGNFLRTILQPAILLTKSKDATDLPKINSVDQCYKTTIDLPTCLENNSLVKDASQNWKFNSYKISEKGTSEENPDLSFLIVNSKQGEKQLFVDLGVYTKNRNFRLYMSSKAGHTVILNIAEDNKFVPKPVNNSCIDEQYFLSSLICNVRFSDCLKILTCDNHEHSREPSLYLEDKISRNCLAPIEGCHCSPYPEIDNFVRTLIKKDNVQGEIRRWNYFSLEQLIVYDISKYRWCRNIGRAHKSNNIMIIIDLKNENWYQKCHDPICRAENFKSESFPLPAEVCLPFLFKEDEDYVGTISENNTEERANTVDVTDVLDSIPFTSMQENNKLNKQSSSVEWDHELDTYLLEASEDVELIEATDIFHTQKNCIVNEIPDELLAGVLRNYEVKGRKEN